MVASDAGLTRLQDASTASFPGLRSLSLDNAAQLPERLPSDVSLLVIEVDPHEPASIQRVGLIRERWPELPVVAAIEGASVSLVRTLLHQGISDVVALPFDVEELLQVCLNVAASSKTTVSRSAALAPTVAVVRSTGGCGATTIATHLAADFAEHGNSPRGAAIVDLDLQVGSVAEYLGLVPRASFSDLLGAEGRLDEELLRSVAIDAGNGLSVVAAPETIMPLESIDTDDLLRIIRLLRRQFGYVVLDLPASWTNWTLSAVTAADAIVLVVELNVSSVRQAQRRLELFRTVGVEEQAIKIVINRVENRLFRTIGFDDIAKALRHPIENTISLDTQALGAAQTQGVLVSKAARKSRFAADIARLGESLRAAFLARAR